MEITGLGGASFERALVRFSAGERVRYRDLDLLLRQTELECRVAAPDDVDTAHALDLLTGARFRLGALLASAPPLADIIGNRRHRYLLVQGAGERPRELYELLGDHLHRLAN